MKALKISAEVAKYMVLQDLASRYILTENEVEVGLKVLQRSMGSYKLSNGDAIGWFRKSWHIVRK